MSMGSVDEQATRVRWFRFEEGRQAAEDGGGVLPTGAGTRRFRAAVHDRVEWQSPGTGWQEVPVGCHLLGSRHSCLETCRARTAACVASPGDSKSHRSPGLRAPPTQAERHPLFLYFFNKCFSFSFL
nr:uncharacterized protein LOC126520237 [Dermacentor andersoni]